MADERFAPRSMLVALGFVVAVNLVGASPSVFFGADTGWFERPGFYPPEWVFPVVWTLLFTLMGLAAYLIWRRGFGRRDVRLALGIFAIQLAINVAWTPVFFGLQRPDFGLVVIVILWFAIVATILAFDRVNRTAALLLVPYLLWVTFASALNAAIYLAWS